MGSESEVCGWGDELPHLAGRRRRASGWRVPPLGPSPGPATARTQHRSARGAQGACAHTARLRGDASLDGQKGSGLAARTCVGHAVALEAAPWRLALSPDPATMHTGRCFARVATASRPHARRLSGGSDGARGVKGGHAGALFDAATVDPTARAPDELGGVRRLRVKKGVVQTAVDAVARARLYPGLTEPQ